jgi:hypothetical protein
LPARVSDDRSNDHVKECGSVGHCGSQNTSVVPERTLFPRGAPLLRYSPGRSLSQQLQRVSPIWGLRGELLGNNLLTAHSVWAQQLSHERV